MQSVKITVIVGNHRKILEFEEDVILLTEFSKIIPQLLYVRQRCKASPSRYSLTECVTYNQTVTL